MSWTEERVELLRQLWSEGLSASQIAVRLGGISRNAVIGKVHRLGLEGRMRSGQPAPRLETEPTAPEPRPVLGALALKPEPAGAPEAEPALQPIPAAALPAPSERLTLLHLTEQTCKWPIGDPGTPGFHFCGQRAELGLPYCAVHARIAYQPAQDRRRMRKLAGLQ
jgi:GcrA cell cycle regulator